MHLETADPRREASDKRYVVPLSDLKHLQTRGHQRTIVRSYVSQAQ